MSTNSLDANSKLLKFAVVNLKAEFGAQEKNLTRITGWVKRLTDQGAEVIGFPEMSLCGYDRTDTLIPYLERIPGASTQALSVLAARYDVLIMAGLATFDKVGNKHISQVAVSPDGVEAVYHKNYLSPKEMQFFSSGCEAAVVQYRGWNIGMQLCYDTHFPTLSEAQALLGADVLFMAFASPNETSEEKCARLMRFLPARAYDNSCYVVSCNLTGIGGSGQQFPGGALAFSTKGKLLARACGESEDNLLVSLKKPELDRIRSNPRAYFLSHQKLTNLRNKQ